MSSPVWRRRVSQNQPLLLSLADAAQLLSLTKQQLYELTVREAGRGRLFPSRSCDSGNVCASGASLSNPGLQNLKRRRCGDDSHPQVRYVANVPQVSCLHLPRRDPLQLRRQETALPQQVQRSVAEIRAPLSPHSKYAFRKLVLQWLPRTLE